MLVVEGVDNSGKSTLIRQLQVVLPGWATQGSEGPPKYKGEMNDRVSRYLNHSPFTIYDRHPCVSQPIYGQMRSDLDAIDQHLVDEFYLRRPFFLYCDPGRRTFEGHTVNPEIDTADHLKAVEENFKIITLAYRHWAIEYAHVVYRIGDDMTQIQRMVETLGRRG